LKLFVLFSFFASSVFASGRVSCEIRVDDSKVFSKQVETTLKTKVLIGETDSVTAYITANADDSYALEAYIPENDSRIYATGILKVRNDKLTVSMWGRGSLIDVSCDLM